MDPDAGLLTDSTATPPVAYTFEVLSSEGITDAANNDFDKTLGATPTLDIIVDTLDPSIIETEVIGNTIVLTLSLSVETASVTGTGGFTVTGSDSVAYPVSSVVVNGTTVTLTLPTGTTPTKRGTYSYSYTQSTDIEIKTSSNNELADISSAAYGPPLSLNFDESFNGDDGYTSNKGLFLYLKTQKAYTPGTNTFTGLLASPSLLGVAEGNVADAIAGPQGSFLDLDGVGGYTSNEGLFLYLKTQKAYTPGTNTLAGLLDSPSLLGAAEARVVVLVNAAKK